MRIDLPWPDAILWPNGPQARNYGHKARITAKHREWARLAALGLVAPETRPIQITIEVHPKPRGPFPDADNCIAACKAMLDGIADALKVNDRDFASPAVVFSPERDGRFVVEVR